jgi:hypothetical protein
MNNQKIKKMTVFIPALIMAVIVFFNNPAVSQQDEPAATNQEVKDDYSTEELKEFIEANREATKVQQEAEQKMVSAIEEEGLDINTFNEILTSQQQGDQQAQMAEEDMEKFNKAAEKVIEIQEETTAEVEEAIQDSGMEVEKYKEMMLAYQQSPLVQEKIHKMLEDQQ